MLTDPITPSPEAPMPTETEQTPGSPAPGAGSPRHGPNGGAGAVDEMAAEDRALAIHNALALTPEQMRFVAAVLYDAGMDDDRKARRAAKLGQTEAEGVYRDGCRAITAVYALLPHLPALLAPTCFRCKAAPALPSEHKRGLFQPYCADCTPLATPAPSVPAAPGDLWSAYRSGYLAGYDTGYCAPTGTLTEPAWDNEHVVALAEGAACAYENARPAAPVDARADETDPGRRAAGEANPDGLDTHRRASESVAEVRALRARVAEAERALREWIVRFPKSYAADIARSALARQVPRG